MSDLTKIEWADRTWNPTTGCSAASEGCRNCYAVRQTKRLEAMGQPKYQGLLNVHQTHFNGVVKCHEDALMLPFKWKKPCRVFVNSMSDLFHPEVPFEFVDKVMVVIALNPHITFQVLTKRPKRMAEYFNQINVGDFLTGVFYNSLRLLKPVEAEVFRQTTEAVLFPLPNLWLGTSVENQAAADERIPHLLRIPAAVRFLSCEPLLGSVDIDDWWYEPRDDSEGLDLVYDYRLEELDWVICGGESGPNARPMQLEWMRSLRDQCKADNVPFFAKQWDKKRDLPSDLQMREFPEVSE